MILLLSISYKAFLPIATRLKGLYMVMGIMSAS